jgi:hypothetical protein
MAFTARGTTLNPSAAYAPIDAHAGVGDWNVVDGGTGAAATTGSRATSRSVPEPDPAALGRLRRAAVDGNSVWIASEYIGAACNYTDWGGPFFAGGTGDNLLGTCGGRARPGGRTACELVDADQQAHSVDQAATIDQRGRPQAGPLSCIYSV